jgi:hypothetical protein
LSCENAISLACVDLAAVVMWRGRYVGQLFGAGGIGAKSTSATGKMNDTTVSIASFQTAVTALRSLRPTEEGRKD